jgi:hypothetical protein
MIYLLSEAATRISGSAAAPSVLLGLSLRSQPAASQVPLFPVVPVVPVAASEKLGSGLTMLLASRDDAWRSRIQGWRGARPLPAGRSKRRCCLILKQRTQRIKSREKALASSELDEARRKLNEVGDVFDPEQTPREHVAGR